MEEVELLIILFDLAILSKDILWWDLYYHKVTNDNSIQFRAFFRVSARSFDFLCSILNDDLKAILYMLLKWESVEENWTWRSKLEYH
jgi:hypothetical protein